MAMAVFPVPRTLASRLLARTSRSFTRPSPVNPLLRVACDPSANKAGNNHRGDWSDLALFYKHARTYATATKKPVGRPKAHTGRAAASTKKTTPKKKATKKPKKKKVVKKPKAKKAPSKTALVKQARKAASDLRAAALLEEPKQLPSTAFSVILVEEAKKTKAFTGTASAASARYKNLSSEEREVCHVAPSTLCLLTIAAIQSPSQPEQTTKHYLV